MHQHTCSKAELQIDDRKLDRVIAAWGKWRQITLAILRLSFRRAYNGALGNQLMAIKARREAQ